MAVPIVPLFIDGYERPATTGATYEVRNPYSRELVTRAASASSRDCQDAIEAAVRAFRTWEHTPLAERRSFLLKAADLLETDRYGQKIQEAMQAETAAAEYLPLLNQKIAMEMLREAASLVVELKGETFPSVRGGQVLAQRRAQGVIFTIAPWNSPIILTIRAMAIPIICGNTVVLKTSEVSPRTQYIIAELFEEAGLPKGVLNLIHTSREDSPPRCAEIIAHPAVKKITFTGSDRVGRLLAAEAAKYLKPCVFELGGKSPAVVLEDADITRAARAITFGALAHSGQICMSTERVIVQRKVAPQLTAALIEHFSKLKTGGPGADLSAQFTEASAENIQAMLNEAKEGGAKFLLGDGTRSGAVIQPHIVSGMKLGMRLWDRESFGPLTVLAEVDTREEAIELANTSDYSLAGSVWTQDVNTAIESAMAIRAGCVNINGPTFHVEDARELSGLGGSSGYGTFSVDSFTDLRLIVIHPAKASQLPLVD